MSKRSKAAKAAGPKAELSAHAPAAPSIDAPPINPSDPGSANPPLTDPFADAPPSERGILAAILGPKVMGVLFAQYI